MASPRERMRASVGACLQRITRANGFATDAGLSFTLEPEQELGSDTTAILTVLVTKQQRPDEPGFARKSRLTTLLVVAKVASTMDQAQAQLDAIVSDIELAMDGRQFQFPSGYDFPQYVQMQPIPPKPGAGFVGAVVTYQSLIPIR